MDTNNDDLEKVCLLSNMSIFITYVKSRGSNLFIFHFVQLFGPLSSWMPPHWLRNTAKLLVFFQFSRQIMLLLAEKIRCVNLSVCGCILFSGRHTNLQVWVKKSQLQTVHLK